MTYVLTVEQPWADLIVAGFKDVENRSWPVPSTLPRLFRCRPCGAERVEPNGRFNADHECSQEGTFWPAGVASFRLGIHAAKKTPLAAQSEATSKYLDIVGIDGSALYILGSLVPDRRGALVGFVTVTGCHHDDECFDVYEAETDLPRYCSPWAERDMWHWTLADPEPLEEPVPMKGRQRLWRLPVGVAA